MSSLRFTYLILFCAIIAIGNDAAYAQKEKEKNNEKQEELKWSPEKKNKSAWPSFKSRDKEKKERATFKKILDEEKSTDIQKEINEKAKKLKKKYKLTKAEINALESSRRGYPMNRKAKRLARKARRKEAKMKRKMAEFVKEKIRESQPESVQKRREKTRKRAERFRRTGSYLPWYKRWWYKLTGEF